MKRMKIPRSTLALSSSGVGKGGGDKAVSRFVYQEKNKAGRKNKKGFAFTDLAQGSCRIITFEISKLPVAVNQIFL